MMASIKKVTIAMLPLLFCQTEGQAGDHTIGQPKFDRSSPATDVPAWESLKPKNGKKALPPSDRIHKQVAPLDDDQPVITPHPRNKELFPKNGADGRMNKEQVGPLDDDQPIFTPHPTKGSKQ